VLVEKSLIKINTQYRSAINHVNVTLHDLVEDMGKEIVRQESRKEPGERSRLWSHDDIVRVLQKNTVRLISMNNFYFSFYHDFAHYGLILSY